MKSVPDEAIVEIAHTFGASALACKTYCDRVLQLHTRFVEQGLFLSTFFHLSSERWEKDLGLENPDLISALVRVCFSSQQEVFRDDNDSGST